MKSTNEILSVIKTHRHRNLNIKVQHQRVLKKLQTSCLKVQAKERKLLKSWLQIFWKQALCKKSPYSELFCSAFFPHFPAFQLNTEGYGVSLCIQSECRKIREKCGPEWLRIRTLFTRCKLPTISNKNRGSWVKILQRKSYKWFTEFFERPGITRQPQGKKDNVYIGRVGGKKNTYRNVTYYGH